VVAPSGCKLQEAVRAAGDVAADEVRVVPLELGRVARARGEDAVMEAGREALDLRIDPVAHVERGAVRDMAVRPGSVLSGRRARVVEKALLREQDEGPLCVPSLPRCAFGFDDLRDRAGEVDGRRLRDLRCAPRDRSIERVVDLEDAGPVPPAL
jgi:hypothetical protein